MLFGERRFLGTFTGRREDVLGAARLLPGGCWAPRGCQREGLGCVHLTCSGLTACHSGLEAPQCSPLPPEPTSGPSNSKPRPAPPIPILGAPDLPSLCVGGGWLGAMSLPSLSSSLHSLISSQNQLPPPGSFLGPTRPALLSGPYILLHGPTWSFLS